MKRIQKPAVLIEQEWYLPISFHHTLHKSIIEHIYKWKGWIDNTESIIYSHKDKEHYKYFANKAAEISKIETLPVLLEELGSPIRFRVEKRALTEFTSTLLLAKDLPKLKMLLSIMSAYAYGRILIFNPEIWKLETLEFSCTEGLRTTPAFIYTKQQQAETKEQFLEELMSIGKKLIEDTSPETSLDVPVYRRTK